MSDAAELWLQSVEDAVRNASWRTFCLMVLERFGKDHHELLIRQLFNIHMTGIVSEYISEYTKIVEQLIAYGKYTDPVYFAMRFVDGLRHDIRQVVHMHRPSTLDFACSLALLQEEMADSSKHWSPRRSDPSGGSGMSLGGHHIYRCHHALTSRQCLQLGTTGMRVAWTPS
jgi:hypothetical protein